MSEESSKANTNSKFVDKWDIKRIRSLYPTGLEGLTLLSSS